MISKVVSRMSFMELSYGRWDTECAAVSMFCGLSLEILSLCRLNKGSLEMFAHRQGPIGPEANTLMRLLVLRETFIATGRDVLDWVDP